ncbi:MAG: tryptophan synthase subunit alpha [Halothiobacillus sp.]|nr:tryptophan synthase subunit alpha [Halothiobacillus sp.]
MTIATSTRLKSTIARLREQQRTGLIVYLTAGDPDFETSLSLLNAAAEADMVEIGIPFSDPVADGATLQQAHMRALASGQTVRKTMQLLSAWREKQPTVPAILMGYLNPVLAYGIDLFMQDAVTAGADALILVDLPFEHAAPYRAAAKKNGLTLIQMVAPTTGQERQRLILNQAEGFVYQVLLNGTTGATESSSSSMKRILSDQPKNTSLPRAIGFGIHSPEQAKELAHYSDFVVVGSEIVRAIHDGPMESSIVRCQATIRAFQDSIYSVHKENLD